MLSVKKLSEEEEEEEEEEEDDTDDDVDVEVALVVVVHAGELVTDSVCTPVLPSVRILDPGFPEFNTLSGEFLIVVLSGI